MSTLWVTFTRQIGDTLETFGEMPDANEHALICACIVAAGAFGASGHYAGAPMMTSRAGCSPKHTVNRGVARDALADLDSGYDAAFYSFASSSFQPVHVQAAVKNGYRSAVCGVVIGSSRSVLTTIASSTLRGRAVCKNCERVAECAAERAQ